MALTKEQFEKLYNQGLSVEQIIKFEEGFVPPKPTEPVKGKGFFENFALDTLQIGDEAPAYVQLVDLFDNQPGWEGDQGRESQETLPVFTVSGSSEGWGDRLRCRYQKTAFQLGIYLYSLFLTSLLSFAMF